MASGPSLVPRPRRRYPRASSRRRKSVALQRDRVRRDVHLGLVLGHRDLARVAVEDPVEVLTTLGADSVEAHRCGAVAPHALHVDGLEIEGFHAVALLSL